MVSDRSGRHTSQKTYPQCRNRVQRPVRSAWEAIRTSREFPKEQVAHAQMGPEVQKVIALASRIASTSDQQVRERYHELVDKRPDLNALERFELERIETRLDAEDVGPRLEARERQWQEERIDLLNSAEDLLARLRSLSV
jgi:hypothetical protein